MLQIANRYLIHNPPHDLLGRGGMGDVYRADDTQTGQIVAVKALKPEAVADAPEMVTRFVREGEVLGKLNHPHIVSWVDAVEEDGRYYLIMEHVGGGSLRDKLQQQGALPPLDVLHLAYALADALTHAHNLHIIHRDLKPDNVLLAEDGTPRLTDFGIAYVADRTRLTDSDMLVGTFGYHSPEAFRGQTLDERADIWSLGVMVYEMLVGERPFTGRNLAATFSAILTQPVPDLRAYQPALPPSLISLIYYMLVKERDKRINSMALVRAELEAIRSGKGTASFLLTPPATSLSFAQYALPASETVFHDWISTILRLHRGGDWLELSNSILAYSPLVTDCFLAGETVSADVRGRAVQSVLRWAVDKLRPAGEHSWLASSWRAYNIVRYFFLEGMRVTELAERLAVAEQTLYQWRITAVATLSRILRDEMENPQETSQRRHYVLADRYDLHTEEEKALLQVTAVYRHPIPKNWLPQLAFDTQTNPRQLIHAGLVQEQEQTIQVHPDIAGYVLGLLPPSEHQQHHRAAAQLYESCHDYLEAAYHWRGAGELETAVHLLLNHYSDIIANRHGEAYAELLAQFQPYEISPDLWSRLKIIAGQVAEILEDVDSALEEYQQALGAADLATQTLAYYRRAKAFQHKNIPESLAHYGYCIQLAQAVEGFPLTAVYIDRAWLYFQELHDLPQAEADLQRAEASIQPNDRRTRSDLHNAWGELYYYKQDMAQAIQHHLQGWLAANEVQDAERMMKSAHNLGLAYAEDGRYQQALDYLQRSQKLAADVGHRKMEGLTYKSIGACYFWLHQLETAINYYGRAYDIFVEMLNHNLQAYICCDLAEAYLQIGQAEAAQPFIDEGITLAQRSGNDELVRLLQGLAQQPLQPEAMLTERAAEALAFVGENGRITNQDYRDLTGVSQKQAVRDLNKLVNDGLLQRVGRGRATRYELA